MLFLPAPRPPPFTSQLHGVYRATSAAELKPDSPLFIAPNSSRHKCPYPVQISISPEEISASINEQSCRHVLEYTERGRFRCKLSQFQCNDLLALLTSVAREPACADHKIAPVATKAPRPCPVVRHGGSSERRIR